MTHKEDSHTLVLPPGTDGPETDIQVPSTPWIDGTADRIASSKPAVAAIFIHAGAGYHSLANENLHLNACSDAARAAMKLLKVGAPAVDAIEAAIKILEDREITNAGFGSNLAIDGTVECDATVVDHLGRSGACGAVPNIKNPISLAKLILEKSTRPMTLRRVPPNLLVGKGAKDFAWENDMPLVPNEWLVSRNAKDRFLRWRDDLKRAESKSSGTTDHRQKSPASADIEDGRHKSQRDHTNAIMMGTWNEGQPDSPGQPSTPLEDASPRSSQSPTGKLKSSTPNPLYSSKSSKRAANERNNAFSFFGSLTSSPTLGSPGSNPSAAKRPKFESHDSNDLGKVIDDNVDVMDTGDGSHSTDSQRRLQNMFEADTASTEHPMLRRDLIQSIEGVDYAEDEDKITDTVGAIAIDQWGNMAAGSSSGGIGMKHRGRVGPAALVGIGTAIIPTDSQHPDQIAVGAVTSGTGEHMATTMASQKCAERLYQGTRRGDGGVDVEEHDESAIMEAFITDDFQNHPGVLNSTSASAIGAMAVKKTKTGYYLYFAHNTDSFALASMSSSDRSPHCVMSRLQQGSTGVAQGARKIHAS